MGLLHDPFSSRVTFSQVCFCCVLSSPSFCALAPKLHPKWLQNGSKIAPTMVPTWSQNCPKMVPKLPPKIVPKCFQNGFKIVPKMIPKRSQYCPKMVSKMVPKWTQHGPNMDLKWTPIAHETIRSEVTCIRSEVTCTKWNDLGGSDI